MLVVVHGVAVQGGIPRLYKGVGFAVIQNPLSRFGDTAANTGVLAALEALQPNMPVAMMTGFASLGNASITLTLRSLLYSITHSLTHSRTLSWMVFWASFLGLFAAYQVERLAGRHRKGR
jgi:hypothetical protein